MTSQKIFPSGGLQPPSGKIFGLVLRGLSDDISFKICTYLVCIMSLIFWHSWHYFACNFLNNGQIFNPIKPLELSQSPLSFCGVYMVFTYVSTVTTCFPLILVYFVSYISTVTTCMYKSYKHKTTWDNSTGLIGLKIGPLLRKLQAKECCECRKIKDIIQ